MSKFKKVSVILLVIVLALSMMPVAFAANNAIIDPSKTGSITIHKFDNTGSVSGGNADGTLITNTSTFGNPLNGITFTITLIPEATISTTVEEAEEYIEENDVAPTRTGVTGSGSNNDGEYIFNNLAQGVYLVQEAENSAVSNTAAPFLVSIPMTNPKNNSSWLYDVHVYPKNTVTTEASIDKKLVDQNGDHQSSITADIGDEVKWAITASIPANVAAIDATNTNKGYFYITDSLDSRLNYKSVVVELVDSTGALKETLAKNTHYSLTEPATGAAGRDNDDIVIDFKTVAGIAKLAAADVGDYIKITVTTTINETAVIDLDDGITNSADLYFNNEDGDPSDPEEPVKPPVDPEVQLTGLALYKYYVDNEGTKQPLNNAIFTIYENSTDAGNNTAIQRGTEGWTEKSGFSNITGAATAVYKNGYIYFSSEDLKTAVGSLTEGQTFYLVETTAPEGYELLNEIIPVALGETVEVENKQLSSDFTLPITGGSGTLLFTIVGVILIGGAVTLLIVSRKRNKASNSK